MFPESSYLGRGDAPSPHEGQEWVAPNVFLGPASLRLKSFLAGLDSLALFDEISDQKDKDYHSARKDAPENLFGKR